MLKINARESFANIGKEVGLSAPAIGKRVRQMEDEGIIEGYALRVNHEKLGIETKAYITLVMHQAIIGTSNVLDSIRAMEEVQRCDRITGDDCICVLGYFKNNRHLIAFLEKISQYGSTKTSIILEV
jgi:Lrp/AsnC family leucine-responsive transcriptional regulator